MRLRPTPAGGYANQPAQELPFTRSFEALDLESADMRRCPISSAHPRGRSRHTLHRRLRGAAREHHADNDAGDDHQVKFER
jgi:hypothetical protein